MQPKLAPPRDGLTVVQVDDLLTGQGVTRGFGLELLDGNNNVVEDISADCQGFTVRHDNTAEVHGSLRVDLARELPWGSARVRPYRTLSKDGVTARFNRGVYVLTTPDTNRGRTPVVYSVSGQDLLQRLTRQVGNTYVIDAGVTYIQALRDLLTNSGVGGTVLLDGTRQGTALPKPMVWAMSTSPRWIDVANDLLTEIAYIDLWCDHDGVFRSSPVAPIDTAAVEHRFDTADPATDVIAADRSETFDAWNAPNSWRFIRRNLDYQPFVGDGIYEVTNDNDGESSIASVGVVHVDHWLDVADQATLEAEGNRIVEADRRAERVFRVRVDPFPIAGHRDVVEYVEGEAVYKVMVSSWEEPTDGKGAWTLAGGPGGSSPERTESQAAGTVTSGTADAGGLRVVVDGATVDSPANALDGATYLIGERVTLTVRNPTVPLVQGKET